MQPEEADRREERLSALSGGSMPYPGGSSKGAPTLVRLHIPRNVCAAGGRPMRFYFSNMLVKGLQAELAWREAAQTWLYEVPELRLAEVCRLRFKVAGIKKSLVKLAAARHEDGAPHEYDQDFKMIRKINKALDRRQRELAGIAAEAAMIKEWLQRVREGMKMWAWWLKEQANSCLSLQYIAECRNAAVLMRKELFDLAAYLDNVEISREVDADFKLMRRVLRTLHQREARLRRTYVNPFRLLLRLPQLATAR